MELLYSSFMKIVKRLKEDINETVVFIFGEETWRAHVEIGKTRNCLEQETLGQVTFVITVEDEGQNWDDHVRENLSPRVHMTVKKKEKSTK